MICGLFYAGLQLLLDVVRLRLGVRDTEAELLLLRHQVRVLRRQVRKAALTPADRAVMAALSQRVSRVALSSLVVQQETVLGWHRSLVRRKWAMFGQRRGPGRPPMPHELRHLILTMAKDNPGWGCVRIRGELLKVGHRVSATAIRVLLRRNRIPPPTCRSRLSWRKFHQAQASAIVVTDFFTVDTVFLKRFYVLLYMQLSTRRVLCFAVTQSPDAAWVTQQARNLAWDIRECGFQPKFLFCDHDTKFCSEFQNVIKGAGMEVIRTPIIAPKANAHCERAIGTARRECFDWLLITGQRHLERVLQEYVDHYNRERPHRGLRLKTPIARSDPVVLAAPISVRPRLGGLINEYSRQATLAYAR